MAGGGEIQLNGVRIVLGTVAAIAALATGAPADAQSNGSASPAPPAARLVAAYPGIVKTVDGSDVVFETGLRLPLDDGRGEKPFADWLAAPDIEDMFRLAYPAGGKADAPGKDFDPGRARNAAFFEAVYGDCRKGGVEKQLVDVAWLPNKGGGRLKVTRINGVAERLRAVSTELDALPASFDVYLLPAAGTYNCRPIAGTSQVSAHGYGIAIDIAIAKAHYWRWSSGGASGPVVYQNAIPLEIVAIFEKHGFIWGGRWHHYDTMHFEYRPELLSPAALR